VYSKDNTKRDSIAHMGMSTDAELFYSTKFVAQLGKGNTAHVFLAQDLNTEKWVVVKVVDTSSKNGRAAVKNEVKALQKMHAHKNIIEMYEVKELDRYAMLYFEYFAGCELYYLLKQYKKLAQHVVERIFDQIVDAVAHMHANRVCHLDLKPENILVNREYKVKIIDYGMSQVALKNGLVESYGGSVKYASPEAIHGGVYNGYLGDSWSCGVVLHLMVYRCFPDRSTRDRIEHDAHTAPYILHAMRDLLHPNTENRVTVSMVKEAKNRE